MKHYILLPPETDKDTAEQHLGESPPEDKLRLCQQLSDHGQCTQRQGFLSYKELLTNKECRICPIPNSQRQERKKRTK